MTRTIRHRGPDDEGIWVDSSRGIGLGFRRLAILDLSEQGHQPMRSESARFTVIFNGEVYNHLELRDQLWSRGHRFRGHSDTEVIAAAFEEWGVQAAAERFVGMFAIAAWDALKNRLHLVRDRLGKKPLFIFARPGFVAFGSELKTLMIDPAFDKSLDIDALAAYLRYLYVPAPATIFKQARKLLPGHILTVDDPCARLPDPIPFWSVADAAERGIVDPFAGSDSDAVDELERLLTEAVRLRLQADVPLGALLSGGIDSTAVVSLARLAGVGRIKTFSIGFPGTEHDEAAHAARIADHLGTDHTEMKMNGTDALEVVPRIPDIVDEPLADPSQIPTYLVCQLARREVTVALSGDGGDEVFAGYNRYVFGPRMIGRASRISRPLRQMMSAAISSNFSNRLARGYQQLYPILPSGLRQRLIAEKVSKMGAMLVRDNPSEMYRSLLSAWQDPETVLTQRSSGVDPIFSALRGYRDGICADSMMLVDQATYLPDDLLAKVDRASMALSLELRIPILDHRVVEFGWRLPAHMKIRDGEGKWLLRQVVYRHVPKPLLDRPKTGFSVPIGDWLRGPLRQWGEDLLYAGSIEREGTLELEPIQRAWERLQAGRGNVSFFLWAVLIFQSWRARWDA